MIAWLIVTLHSHTPLPPTPIPPTPYPLPHTPLPPTHYPLPPTVWCWGLVLGSGVGVWCWGLVLGSGVLPLYQAHGVPSRVRQRCPEDAVGAAGVRGHRVVAGGINNKRAE
jgi:hypothetical protein